MRRILAIILFTPFLVCDPQAGVLTYNVSGLGDNQTVVAQADGSIRMDLAGVSNGPHSIVVRACAEPWGCSDGAPFSFTKPALGKPGNIKFGR